MDLLTNNAEERILTCCGKHLEYHPTSWRGIRVYKGSWNYTSWSKKLRKSSHFQISLESSLGVNLNEGLIWIILSLISVFRIRYYCWKTQSNTSKIWLVKICYRWRHMYDQCIHATVGYLMRRYYVKDTNCQYFQRDHGNEVKWLPAQGAKFFWNGSTLALF